VRLRLDLVRPVEAELVLGTNLTISCLRLCSHGRAWNASLGLWHPGGRLLRLPALVTDDDRLLVVPLVLLLLEIHWAYHLSGKRQCRVWLVSLPAWVLNEHILAINFPGNLLAIVAQILCLRQDAAMQLLRSLARILLLFKVIILVLGVHEIDNCNNAELNYYLDKIYNNIAAILSQQLKNIDN